MKTTPCIQTSLVALTCILSISCSQNPDPNIVYRLPVNAIGDYDVSFEKTAPIDAYAAQEKHIEEMLEAVKLSKKKKVLVFVHGGLGTKNSWTERIEDMVPLIKDDDYHPVIITWRSGIFTSLKDRYVGVRNGVDKPKTVTLVTSPFYAGSDFLKGFAAIPEAISEQTANFVETHTAGWESIENNLLQFSEQDPNYSKSIHYTGYGEDVNFGQRTGYRVKQFVPGVSRLVTTPLLEGAGDDAWNIMLRRARILTHRQLDLHSRGIENQGGYYRGQTENYSKSEIESDFYEPYGPNGVAAQFIRGLSEIKGIEITLVGHSMGAIVANDLVQAFPNTKFSRIIHMGSADSNRSLMEKTFPYLKENPSTDFWNLCLHPSNELREQSAFGAVPEGSLLIWLDYFLTNPETTLDRRAGCWDNAKWIAPQFAQLPNAKMKVFGRRDTHIHHKEDPTRWPIKHGDFGNRAFWRPSFYAVQ